MVFIWTTSFCLFASNDKFSIYDSNNSGMDILCAIPLIILENDVLVNIYRFLLTKPKLSQLRKPCGCHEWQVFLHFLLENLRRNGDEVAPIFYCTNGLKPNVSYDVSVYRVVDAWQLLLRYKYLELRWTEDHDW